nr:hypothetical protein GCM10017611_76960 [Rhodococcus wratislaviensis]
MLVTRETVRCSFASPGIDTVVSIFRLVGRFTIPSGDEGAAGEGCVVVALRTAGVDVVMAIYSVRVDGIGGVGQRSCPQIV